MKKVLSLILISCAVLFTGCASAPSYEKMKADTEGFVLPKLPEDGKAIVYVVRPAAVGGLIRFNVFVDDKEASSEMGYTRGSQYIYFNLAPGEHNILSKAENWAQTPVNAKAGDIIFIQQNAEMGVLIARNSIAKIEEVEGKYHVKNLKLGTVIKADK